MCPLSKICLGPLKVHLQREHVSGISVLLFVGDSATCDGNLPNSKIPVTTLAYKFTSEWVYKVVH